MKLEIKESYQHDGISCVYQLEIPRYVLDFDNIRYHYYNKKKDNQKKFILKANDNLEIFIRNGIEQVEEIDLDELSKYIFFFKNQLPYRSYKLKQKIDVSENILIKTG